MMTAPLYFLETKTSKLGRWFIECDRDSNSRAHVIGLIRSGEVDPVKVLEVCEDEGTVRDVTDEIKAAAIESAFAEFSPVDLQALAFDHERDLRKHSEIA